MKTRAANARAATDRGGAGGHARNHIDHHTRNHAEHHTRAQTYVRTRTRNHASTHAHNRTSSHPRAQTRHHHQPEARTRPPPAAKLSPPSPRHGPDRAGRGVRPASAVGPALDRPPGSKGLLGLDESALTYVSKLYESALP